MRVVKKQSPCPLVSEWMSIEAKFLSLMYTMNFEIKSLRRIVQRKGDYVSIPRIRRTLEVHWKLPNFAWQRTAFTETPSIIWSTRGRFNAVRPHVRARFGEVLNMNSFLSYRLVQGRVWPTTGDEQPPYTRGTRMRWGCHKVFTLHKPYIPIACLYFLRK